MNSAAAVAVCGLWHYTIVICLCLTFIVDLAVAVDINLADHLVHFLVGQLLPDVGHHMAQFGDRNHPGSVAVEDTERLADLLLLVASVGQEPRHHLVQLGQRKRPTSCDTKTSLSMAQPE